MWRLILLQPVEMDFLFCGDWMKTALIWLIHDGLDVVLRNSRERWSSDCVIIDKNEIRWTDVEDG